VLLEVFAVLKWKVFKILLGTVILFFAIPAPLGLLLGAYFKSYVDVYTWIPNQIEKALPWAFIFSVFMFTCGISAYDMTKDLKYIRVVVFFLALMFAPVVLNYVIFDRVMISSNRRLTQAEWMKVRSDMEAKKIRYYMGLEPFRGTAVRFAWSAETKLKVKEVLTRNGL
jgi:hypothetical protein